MPYGRNMRNARLKDRVLLQRKGVSEADFEPVEHWTTYGEAWAERRDAKGDEVVSNLQTRSQMTTVFRIHYRQDVKPSHRLIFRERVFDIKAVTTRDARERWLLLTCTEYFSDGD